GRVLIQRNPRMAALLRTVMDQPVFTDVEITTAGVTMPVIRKSSREVVLELAVMNKVEELLFSRRAHRPRYRRYDSLMANGRSPHAVARVAGNLVVDFFLFRA